MCGGVVVVVAVVVGSVYVCVFNRCLFVCVCG